MGYSRRTEGRSMRRRVKTLLVAGAISGVGLIYYAYLYARYDRELAQLGRAVPWGEAIGVFLALVVSPFLLTCIVSWVLGYGHLGWRRIAISASAIGAFCCAVYCTWDYEELFYGLHYPWKWTPVVIASALAAIFAPAAILLSRNVVLWIVNGFPNHATPRASQSEAPSCSPDRR